MPLRCGNRGRKDRESSLTGFPRGILRQDAATRKQGLKAPWICTAWLSSNAERSIKFGAVKVNDDGALDVKSGCLLIAVRPTAYTFGGGPIGRDIHFDIFDTVFFQIGARPSATRAPRCAIHDDIGGWRRRGLGLGGLPGRCSLRLQLDQDAEKLFVVGLIVDVVNVHVTHAALFVNDEEGALRSSILTQNAKALGDLAVRVEVAQKWVGDASQAFGPRGEARNAVHTDTQNLGIQPFEAAQCGLVRRDLVCSNGCPGQWEEGDDNILFATVVVQVDLPPVVALQCEIRGLLPY